MATLADELLQDFEDSGSEGENAGFDNGLPGGLNTAGIAESQHGDGMDLDGDEEAPEEDDEMIDHDEVDGNSDTAHPSDVNTEIKPTDDTVAAKERIEKMEFSKVHDVRSVAHLMRSLTPVLEKIAYYKVQDSKAQNIGNIEDNPEYHLLTRSNSLSTTIDSEIMLVHKFIRDHYSVRFEELERLLENPLDYARTVAILGNGPFDTSNISRIQDSTENPLGVSLRSVLDGPSLMVVSVEAAANKGRQMSPEELERVVRACKMVVDLYNAKDTLTSYVQSRMNIFAPNLTALIGSLAAAQLLNAAGGLIGLVKTPAANIPSWGSKKKSNLGLATNVGIRQQGFLFHSPIVQEAPADLKRNAMRIVGAKVVLAARIDRIHQSPDGQVGQDMAEQCRERLRKLGEPAPNARRRALPAPDDKPSRKRGGRRARKAKEALAMTDLRKAQNRMAFGKEEKEVGYGTGDSTAGMGMIGMENDGRVRALQVDHRTRAKLSKNHKGWGAPGGTTTNFGGSGPGDMDLRGKGLRTTGVGTQLGAAAGTMSSLAFNTGQGLELVAPKSEADRKRKADSDKFLKSGTFTQLGTPRKRLDTGAGKMGPPPVPQK